MGGPPSNKAVRLPALHFQPEMVVIPLTPWRLLHGVNWLLPSLPGGNASAGYSHGPVLSKLPRPFPWAPDLG